MRDHRIAIQGAQSSFHHLAARKYFGTEGQFLHCRTFGEVCRALSVNAADYAVMAIENALAGSILSNYELIRSFDLKIIAEEYIPVELHLAAHPSSKTEALRRVTSHPVALAQCQTYLQQNPRLEWIEGSDTATCAEEVSRMGRSDMACIVNQETASRHGLNIIDRNIQDDSPNETRFLVLCKNGGGEGKKDKASLSFSLEHEVGSLADVLSVFKRHGVNLSKIQSVPVKGNPWAYTFHVDVLWDNYVDYCSAVKKVQKMTGDLCIMGEYLAAPLPLDMVKQYSSKIAVR